MKPKLCCIEPSNALRQFVAGLARSGGWEVEAYADLPEAEESIKHRVPDLISTASVLPSGLLEQTVNRLRAMPNAETIPIVLLTAEHNAEIASRALEAGITEVFQKDRLEAFQTYLEDLREDETEDLSGMKALVLDDEKSVGMYLQTILTDLGLVVDRFETSEEALAAIAGRAYNLIVTDLVLANGESGNHFIRKAQQSTSAPIIAVSGFPDDARRIEALRSGAATFINKPVTEAELAIHVRRLLHKKGTSIAKPGNQSMLCGAQVCGLSEREQLICSLLEVGHSDKLIARQIGISYWTVRTHLGRIFRKCGVSNRVELVNVLRNGVSPEALKRNEAHQAVMDWLTLTGHVMDSLHYGLIVTDENYVIIRVNPAFTEITGFSSAELIGMTPEIFQSGMHKDEFYETLQQKLEEQGCWSGEIWNRHKNEQLYLGWLDVRRLPPDMPLGARYVGVISDITERYVEAERIRHSALHDALTGLANRANLQERTQQEITRAQRTGSTLACIFIDLDHFKPINDTQGHEIGDYILCEVAERLRTVFRANDTVARFGGDEFVAIAPDIADREDALALASKIIDAFNHPIQVEGKSYSLSASVGISLYPEDAATFEKLLSQADAAMYLAKHAGGNQVCFHQPTLSRSADARQDMERRLRQAIDCGEFELWFQPKFDLESNSMIGAEALLRWNHPDRGMVSAHEFIPLAESTGLILPIGNWVLREACRVLQRVQARKSHHFAMSVNVSSRQIARQDFIDEVAHALASSGAEAANLQLEITESTLQRSANNVASVLNQLTESGVSMALDNFGNGQANFASLRNVHFDTLKVDRKFIDDVHADRYNGSFARAAVQLANGLNMKMVAEGVENVEQADYLKDIGCHQVQGYWFGKPMPETELMALLEAYDQVDGKEIQAKLRRAKMDSTVA